MGVAGRRISGYVDLMGAFRFLAPRVVQVVFDAGGVGVDGV